jgi:ATP-dependent DNA helicase RecG
MDYKDFIHIVDLGESEKIEFKSSFNHELIETIVAFSNSIGGKIITGINQKKEFIGLTVNDESVQNWVNEIKTKTSPQIIPDVEIVEFENKKYVIFGVQEYPIKPVATKGKYFKRRANSNHLLSTSEVVNLHLQSFNSSWDYHINSRFKLEDLSFDKVQLAIEAINSRGGKITDDPLTFLIKNDLVRNGKISNAAYFLFTSRDTVLTTIELGRFQTDIIIKDSVRTKSDILAQIEEVLNFVRKHINKEIIITGEARNTERWQYPLEAIREIVLNMIVHRDYRSSSDSIVKIYNNKIEFYNQGLLPENITVEDLLSNNYKSTPRNRLIADFFKNMGLIEKYGSGIQRIVNHFKEAGLAAPQFTNISDGFMVTVFSKNVIENVTENVTENRKVLIIEMIRNDNRISTTEIAEKLKVARRTVARDIENMKLNGVLKRIGPDKGGHWQIINKSDN